MIRSTSLASAVVAVAWVLRAGAQDFAPSEPILAWEDVLAITAAHPADTPEQDAALKLLASKAVRLRLAFVRTETEKDNTRWHLYKHAQGDAIFHCWVFPKRKIKLGEDGWIGGRIRKIVFLEKGLRESLFTMHIDALSFEPASTIQPDAPPADAPTEPALNPVEEQEPAAPPAAP